MSPPRIAIVIPAYNEEKTVANVVAAAKASSYVSDIIVVSDGSHDRTAEVAREAGATVYQLPKKGGKAEAMLHGVAHTDASIIMFMDADLIGVTPDHIERVLLPVISGSRIMNVGLHDRGFLNALTPHLPLIGGERAMVRQVVEGVPAEFMRGFMVEAALNFYCRSRKLPYGSVLLPGLQIRRKIDKVGWKKGLQQYVAMFLQVGQAMLIVRLAHLFNRF